MSASLDHKRKVYAIRDLPTLPVIAQKVLTLADDDAASAERLTAIISSDQSLSAKVLALANSAYYGYRGKIGTIRQAVIVIGTNMLKQLSLSVLVCGTVGRDGKKRTEFWLHSFATATASSLIAKRTGIRDGDLAFMGGLLHDIGKIVIETYFPDQHDMDHTEVGSWMAERWQLPEPLINAIAFHHSLAPEHIAQPVTACVHAGNMCAKRAITASTADLATEVMEALKLTNAGFLAVVEEVRTRKPQMEKLIL